MVWIESITSSAGGSMRAERRQDIAHAGFAGRAAHRRVGQPQPPGAQPHLIGGFLARDIDDRHRRCAPCAPAACSSRVDLPMPGSPPIRTTLPGTSPPALVGAGHAAQGAVKLADAGRQPLGQRHIIGERRHGKAPPAGVERVLGGERRHHRRGFGRDGVPFLAVPALPLPARRHRPAGLADIAGGGTGHQALRNAEQDRT